MNLSIFAIGNVSPFKITADVFTPLTDIITSNLPVLIPVAVGLMVLMMGPTIFRKLIKKTVST